MVETLCCPECGKPLRFVYRISGKVEFWKCVEGHRVRFTRWGCTVVKVVHPIYMFVLEGNIGNTRVTNVGSVGGEVLPVGVEP